ncbi:MAG TPA: ATP-binding cassette domain-containing protein [Acidimicrobiales bacterium]|nr:ATP-binding cassette domain-containing protein [Acidimicrobiales bacterium]
MTEANALKAVGISVNYGQFRAVESASLRVATGEFVALIGPNGHGKSSLVGAIAGITPRRGVVEAFGEPVAPGSPQRAVRAGLVLVPERRHLYPGLSVRDNVLLGAYSRSRALWATRAWREVADVVELFPELRPHLAQAAGTLSGGQQQMVALARGLAARPRVLLLDEPCLGLAESVSRRVYETLTSLNRAGMTVLLVEENPIRALEICGRTVRMYQGVVRDEDAAAPGHRPGTPTAAASSDRGSRP